MANEGLQIQIGADVRQAVQGMNQLQAATVKTGQSLNKLNPQIADTNATLTNFGRIVQDAPFGIIGIANNIDPLVNSFQQLRTQTGSTGAAFKALAGSLIGPAGVAIAVSAVTSALIAFGPEISRFLSSQKQVSENANKAAEAVTREYTQVLLLKTAYEQSKGDLNERKNILSQLNQISDKYFGGLKAEKTAVEDLQGAYDAYINNLIRSFAVKQLEADLEPLIKRLVIAQSTIKRIGPDIERIGGGLQNIDLRNLTDEQRAALSTSGIFKYNAAINESKQLWDEINALIKNSTALTVESTRVQKENAQATQKVKDGLTFDQFRSNLNKGFADSLEDVNERFDKSAEGAAKAAESFRKFREAQLAAQGIDSTGVTQPPTTVSGPVILTDQNKIQEALDKWKLYNAELQRTSEIISGGINSSVDQFFNALANNQDPFKALVQSAQRLVAELAAAAVKALILRAITKGFSGGGDINIAEFNNLFGGRAQVRGPDLSIAVGRGIRRR